MSVGEIHEHVQYWSSDVCLEFAKMILKDFYDDKIHLCSCLADVKKVTGICQTVEESKYRRPTGNQDYCIKFFIAENLSAYYRIDSEDDISNAYKDIQRNRKKITK